MGDTNSILTTIKEYAIPYYSHTYDSKLSAEDIRNRLRTYVDTEKRSMIDQIFSPRSTKNGTYRGTVDGSNFKIHRIKRGKNSYRPIVVGLITPSVNTTQIHVVMRLPYYAFISFIVWLGIMSYLFIGGDADLSFSQNSYVIVPLMFCFAYVVATISFNVEASKTKKFLKKILEPTERNNQDNWIIRN